jgi:hypothetical protein
MAVHLKLGRELSSATAHVGEEVNFEVAEPVIVNGRTVIDKGAPAAGTVTEAEPKGRMGKVGKLNVSVSSVQLANPGSHYRNSMVKTLRSRKAQK